MWKVNKNQEPEIQCSLVKSPLVFIEHTPRQKIQLLMNEYTHQEWLAYLKGRISDKSNIFVEDIEIPPHKEASVGSAEAEPFHIPKDCVGIIHSHHGMGAFHSGTDQTYVDKNFSISITVARNGTELAYDAVSYTQTPCGKPVTSKSTVKYVQPQPTFDQEKFLKKAKENIDKGRIQRELMLKPLQGHYIPAQYRLKPEDFEMVVDSSGHVLTRKELEDIRANSYWERDD